MWWFIVKQQFTPVNHCFTKKKKLKERCYLHSVQQTYEKNSCKPGIKYFTSINCQFTLVNHHFTVICQFTLVNCHFTLVNCCITVIRWFTLVNRRFTVIHFTKDHLLRTATFLVSLQVLFLSRLPHM